jgi:phosphatidate cytidylyltransferase
MAPDDLSREPRPPGDPEGVKILSAEEVAAAVNRPDVATRIPAREPANPPPPPVVNVGPPTGENDLLHWTEPATGQVPAVVIGDSDNSDRPAADSTRWRSEHDTSEHGDLMADLASFDLDEPVAERLGALDTDERITDEAYLNFDDVDMDPRRSGRRGSRRSRQSRENAGPLAAIIPPDLAGTGSLPPPPATASAGTIGSNPVSRREARRPIPPTPPTPEAPIASGGGERNIAVAAAVGIGIAIVAAVLFKAGPSWTMVLIEIVLVAAGVEFFGALQRSGFRPATLLGLVALAGLPVAAYWKGESAIPAIIFLTFVFGVVWYLFGIGGRARPTANLGVTLLAVIWIGVLGSYAALIVDIPAQGVSILLLAVIATVAHDVGAFFFGRAMGRSPLIAASPNKTVEGFVGGFASTVFAVFVFAVVLKVGPFGAGKALLLGVILGLVAPLGDLAESLFKRDLGLKDMGTVLPQHGGLLDRFDGLLFVLPTTYYVARSVGLS